jgi:hypothetical protein
MISAAEETGSRCKEATTDRRHGRIKCQTPGDLSEVEEDMKLLSHSDEGDLPDTPEIVMKTKEE